MVAAGLPPEPGLVAGVLDGCTALPGAAVAGVGLPSGDAFDASDVAASSEPSSPTIREATSFSAGIVTGLLATEYGMFHPRANRP